MYFISFIADVFEKALHNPTVVKDGKDFVVGKDVLMVAAAPTAESEDIVSYDLRSDLPRSLQKYCRFFDVQFQEV